MGTWHQSKYSKNLPSTSSINTTLCPSCPSTISHPSSHPPLPSAPSSTTLHPSQFSAQSSVTLTTASKLPTQRRSLSSQRRLPLLLPLTELPLSEAPFNHTVLVLDQCYRYSLLQGSRLFGIFDLLRQLCPI